MSEGHVTSNPNQLDNERCLTGDQTQSHKLNSLDKRTMSKQKTGGSKQVMRGN